MVMKETIKTFSGIHTHWEMDGEGFFLIPPLVKLLEDMFKQIREKTGRDHPGSWYLPNTELLGGEPNATHRITPGRYENDKEKDD